MSNLVLQSFHLGKRELVALLLLCSKCHVAAIVRRALGCLWRFLDILTFCSSDNLSCAHFCLHAKI